MVLTPPVQYQPAGQYMQAPSAILAYDPSEHSVPVDDVSASTHTRPGPAVHVRHDDAVDFPNRALYFPTGHEVRYVSPESNNQRQPERNRR